MKQTYIGDVPTWSKSNTYKGIGTSPNASLINWNNLVLKSTIPFQNNPLHQAEGTLELNLKNGYWRANQHGIWHLHSDEWFQLSLPKESKFAKTYVCGKHIPPAALVVYVFKKTE